MDKVDKAKGYQSGFPSQPLPHAALSMCCPYTGHPTPPRPRLPAAGPFPPHSPHNDTLTTATPRRPKHVLPLHSHPPPPPPHPLAPAHLPQVLLRLSVLLQRSAGRGATQQCLGLQWGGGKRERVILTGTFSLIINNYGLGAVAVNPKASSAAHLDRLLQVEPQRPKWRGETHTETHRHTHSCLRCSMDCTQVTAARTLSASFRSNLSALLQSSSACSKRKILRHAIALHREER